MPPWWGLWSPCGGVPAADAVVSAAGAAVAGGGAAAGSLLHAIRPTAGAIAQTSDRRRLFGAKRIDGIEPRREARRIEAEEDADRGGDAERQADRRRRHPRRPVEQQRHAERGRESERDADHAADGTERQRLGEE